MPESPKRSPAPRLLCTLALLPLLLLPWPALADPAELASPQPPCAPPMLCQPGQVVGQELQALALPVAREALLALRLLPDLRLDLRTCQDDRAGLQSEQLRWQAEAAALAAREAARATSAAGPGSVPTTGSSRPGETSAGVSWGTVGIVAALIVGAAGVGFGIGRGVGR